MIGSIVLVEQKSYMTNVPSFYLLDYSPSLPTILHSRLEDEIPFVLVFVNSAIPQGIALIETSLTRDSRNTQYDSCIRPSRN